MSAEDYGTDYGYEYDETSADSHSDGTDIGLTDGLNNLYQAIQNRILTPMGTLPLHPTYGSRLHTLIGKGNNPIIESLVKMMVVECLQYENRIGLIRNIDIRFNRTTQTIHLSLDILSIYSPELLVEVEVGG